VQILTNLVDLKVNHSYSFDFRVFEIETKLKRVNETKIGKSSAVYYSAILLPFKLYFARK